MWSCDVGGGGLQDAYAVVDGVTDQPAQEPVVLVQRPVVAHARRQGIPVRVLRPEGACR
ncbi:hypothetical protein SUDANB176_00285 [Streptomyces sp. enrichment culture]